MENQAEKDTIQVNKSEELTISIKKIKKKLGIKLKKLVAENSCNINHQESIKNIAKKIEDLEGYTNEISQLYSYNPKIMTNFRKRTNEIQNEIELLK